MGETPDRHLQDDSATAMDRTGALPPPRGHVQDVGLHCVWPPDAPQGIVPLERAVLAGRTCLPSGGASLIRRHHRPLVLDWDARSSARQKSVSRVHAEIFLERERVRVRNVGSKPISVDGALSAPGGEVLARVGSVIRIADYVLVVASTADGWYGPLHGVHRDGRFDPLPADVWRADVLQCGLAFKRDLERALSMLRAHQGPKLFVLRLTGPTGAGKELAAEAFYYLSRPLAERRNMAAARGAGGDPKWRAVNCAALPENMIPYEFFGLEEGTFQGVVPSPGAFREVHPGGVLFLDEIHALPRSGQEALLRTLSTGEIQVPRSRQTKQVNVIVVTATNEEIGLESLASRMSGCVLAVPPLGARRHHLPMLALHYFERAFSALSAQRALPEWDARLVEAVCLHEWPANVRELATEMTQLAGECVASRAARVSFDSVRSPHAVPPPASFYRHVVALFEGRFSPPTQGAPLAEQRDRQAAQSLVRAKEGNLVEAAAAMGITAAEFKAAFPESGDWVRAYVSAASVERALREPRANVERVSKHVFMIDKNSLARAIFHGSPDAMKRLANLRNECRKR